jgi:hypothetical protein
MQTQEIENLSTFAVGLLADEEISISVSDNALKIQNDNKDNLGIVYKDITGASSENFEFETEVNLLSTSEHGGFGLIIGWDGKLANESMDNYLRFLLEPNGKFSIDYFSEGSKEVVITDDSTFANTGLAKNKIKIQKIENAINVYVNDNLLGTVEVSLFGTQFGFIVGPLTILSVNSFSFAIPETGETAASEIPNQVQEEQENNLHVVNRSMKNKLRFRVFFILLLLVIVLFHLMNKKSRRHQYYSDKEVQNTIPSVDVRADSTKK